MFSFLKNANKFIFIKIGSLFYFYEENDVIKELLVWSFFYI